MDNRQEIALKAKANISAFLTKVNAIRSYEDEPDYNEQSDIRNDDSDGVACRLASDVDRMQRARLAALNDLFDPTEQETVPVARTEPKDRPADINRKGKYGYTLMHQAVLAHDAMEVSRLKDLGARWDISDNGGQTAWDKAYNRGFDDLLVILEPGFVRTTPVETFDYDE